MCSLSRIVSSGCFAIAAFLGVTAAAAAAEPRVGERFSDWTFDCTAISANVNKCVLTQTLLATTDSTGNQGRVLKLTLGQLGTEGELVLLALAPLGIYIPAGVAGKVDQDEQFPMILQSCTERGCEAAVQVGPELLQSMKAGENLLIGFNAQSDGKTITVPASLKGLTAGLKALGL